jgi:hypothetical protein
MPPHYTSISQLLPSYAQSLLASTGVEFVRQIGLDATTDVVIDILSGRNLRDSTEMITRRRLAILNGALLAMFIESEGKWPGFAQQLPAFAAQQLQQGRLSKTERWLADWALGLTEKSVQNVLRDESRALIKYQQNFVNACLGAIENLKSEHGELVGQLKLGENPLVQVTWHFMVSLLSAAGTQTLTIRGSEKSTYGKLFERLVLGSLLSILGFHYVAPGDVGEHEKVFWLSDRGGRRESDATLL